MVKNLLKSMGIIFITILLFSIIFGILNLFYIKIPKIIYLIILIITMIISGYYLGIHYDKQLYQKGLLLGFITSFIFFLLSIKSFKLIKLLGYLIIILSSAFGSILSQIKNKE